MIFSPTTTPLVPVGTAMRNRRRRRWERRPAILLAACTGAVFGMSGLFAVADSGGTDTSADSNTSRSAMAVGQYNYDFFGISDWDDSEKDELMEYGNKFHELRDHVTWPWRLSQEEKRWLVDSWFSAGNQRHHKDVGLEVSRRRLLAEANPVEVQDTAKDIERRDETAKINFSIRGGGNAMSTGKKANKVATRQSAVDTFKCYDDDPDRQVPCPPNNFGAVCDKFNSNGSFRECFRMCQPSFCCIHDSLSKTYSPSCAITEPNCPSYFPCYIVWWKLHDTIGPANNLRTDQDEPFYDMTFEEITEELRNDSEGPFSIFQQLFGHHFDTEEAPTDGTFEDPDKW